MCIRDRVWDGEQVVEMTMAEYLPGVVRGEMPASFHQQALDAQAVAERTFICYHMASGRKAEHPDADVCMDYHCCNAYTSAQAAAEKWGEHAAEYEAKKPAVEEKKEEAQEAAPVEPITGPTIDAPMGGKVVEIKVKVGDQVKKDDVVLVYEAMKMENDILSTLNGKVKRILVKENDVVGTNDPLIEFE